MNSVTLSDLMHELCQIRAEIDGIKSLLTEGKQEWLTTDEACKRMRISRATMNRRLANGEIPFVAKMGGKLLFRADLVDAYIGRVS